MVRMKDERLPKTSESKKQELCRKREDCVKKLSKKGRGGRKVERQVQQQLAMEKITKVGAQRNDNITTDQPPSLQNRNERKNKTLVYVYFKRSMVILKQ